MLKFADGQLDRRTDRVITIGHPPSGGALMILHNMTSFKFICVLYQFHRQTLLIMKIDRGQIQFQEYVSTGTEPVVALKVKCD